MRCCACCARWLCQCVVRVTMKGARQGARLVRAVGCGNKHLVGKHDVFSSLALVACVIIALQYWIIVLTLSLDCHVYFLSCIVHACHMIHVSNREIEDLSIVLFILQYIRPPEHSRQSSWGKTIDIDNCIAVVMNSIHEWQIPFSFVRYHDKVTVTHKRSNVDMVQFLPSCRFRQWMTPRAMTPTVGNRF